MGVPLAVVDWPVSREFFTATSHSEQFLAEGRLTGDRLRDAFRLRVFPPPSSLGAAMNPGECNTNFG